MGVNLRSGGQGRNKIDLGAGGEDGFAMYDLDWAVVGDRRA